GSEVLVGALVCEPADADCQAGVIFFNNVGYLGMCGHGMIGVMETLRHLGRVKHGCYQIETPVGIVNTTLNQDGSVSIENVPSYRSDGDVELQVDGVGRVVGDVAWGGNWFFLVRQPQPRIELERVEHLLPMASAIRRAVNAAGFAQVDHVELFAAGVAAGSDSRNFVLCPGLEYDRSPCGTGTSAKLACLAAEGRLQPGQTWTQEGVLGTTFAGQYSWVDSSQEKIRPLITGSAHIIADAQLLLDSQDPFRWGIVS
ncbi:MAG: proline racemase family protein, partial [Pirellulales bacterium]|nr:proline racemase family protein [Pirellulales bacterium]